MAFPNTQMWGLGLGLFCVTGIGCGGGDDTSGAGGTAALNSPASGATSGATAPQGGTTASAKGGAGGTGGTGSAATKGGSGGGGSAAKGGSGGGGATNKGGTGAGSTVTVPNPLTNPASGPAAGDPEKKCAVPAEAGLADVSKSTNVVGTGTAASCTGAAFIAAVAKGGVITFNCGPDPVTITLDSTAKVVNNASDDIVIDGGGKVTLSGGGRTRILYMNTCDEKQKWTTDHCDNQETPRLTLQNITFVDANSKSESEFSGGGAVWVRGGRLKVVNSRFFNNVCADGGQDLGGGAIRAFSQYQKLPIYVVNSTFGGAEGFGNVCSNGGGISSIDVSWTIINSVFTHNKAIGNGGNPAQSGTPGGGSGGAIYNDGLTMTLSLCGTKIEDNAVNAFGSAIFFISNNHQGTLNIDQSVIRNNTGGSWYTLPGISMHDDTVKNVSNSTLE